MGQYYEIRNLADETAEVWIYDQVGEDFFGEGVTAKGFVKDLTAIKASQIDLHINSPGGSVFDGQAIFSALVRHPAKVTTYVDGVAASIASVIALAGEKVIMAKNALMMIHKPWGMSMGSAEDMRKYADVLDKVEETITTVYEDKTLLDTDTIKNLMAEETWMTADEAVDYGFADEVGQSMAAAALDFSAFNYKHIPETSPAVATAENETVGEPDPTPEDGGEPASPSDEYYLSLQIGAATQE